MAEAKPQDYANRQAWKPRPWLSRAIRVGVFVLPIAAAIGSTVVLGRVVPRAGWGLAGRIGWLVAMFVVATVVSNLVAKRTERILPLSALCQLNLAFPEEAPNRVKLALRMGNAGRSERILDEFQRQGLADDPQAAALQTIELITALNNHDRKTRGHAEKVRALSDVIAQELELPEHERNLLRWASLLHDVGKISVPAEILNKNGKPTDEEWAILKNHPAEGTWRIAPLRPWLGEWADCVDGHHERFDGTGYPQGLRGDQIAMSSRIVAIADSFEVMTAARSYKKPMSYEDARAELVRCSGTHFDPQIVRAFLHVGQRRTRMATGLFSSWLSQLASGNGPVSTLVQTVTGGVTASGGASILAPLVKGVQVALSPDHGVGVEAARGVVAAAKVHAPLLAAKAVRTTIREKVVAVTTTTVLATGLATGSSAPTIPSPEAAPLTWSAPTPVIPDVLAFAEPDRRILYDGTPSAAVAPPTTEPFFVVPVPLTVAPAGEPLAITARPAEPSATPTSVAAPSAAATSTTTLPPAGPPTSAVSPVAPAPMAPGTIPPEPTSTTAAPFAVTTSTASPSTSTTSPATSTTTRPVSTTTTRPASTTTTTPVMSSTSTTIPATPVLTTTTRPVPTTTAVPSTTATTSSTTTPTTSTTTTTLTTTTSTTTTTTTTIPTVPVVTATGCGSGQWAYEAFNNMTLTGPGVANGCEASIVHGWGTAAPFPGVNPDGFSVAWEAVLAFPGGDATFIMRSDDGIRLYLDGVRIFDLWTYHTERYDRLTLSVAAGNHDVRFEYFDNTADAIATLAVEVGTGSPGTTVPPPVTTTTTSPPTTLLPALISTMSMPATGGGIDGVAADGAGNTYLLDSSQHRVYRRNLLGIVTAFAGSGTSGFSGDGSLATLARLDDPSGIAVSPSGELFIADRGNRRIRRVTTAGIISTVAGTGSSGSAGDGGAPTSATFQDPAGIAVRPNGRVLVADRGARVVREINLAGNTIATVFGNGTQSGGGDGQPATATGLGRPVDVSAYDTVFAVVDDKTGKVWEVTADGVAHFVAGGGAETAAGSFGNVFGFGELAAVAVLEDGTTGTTHDIYVLDAGTSRLWRINRQSGRVEAYAGTGTAGSANLIGAAIVAQLNRAKDVVSRPGFVYLADTGNDALRMITL